jgi:hypothetical protein
LNCRAFVPAMTIATGRGRTPIGMKPVDDPHRPLDPIPIGVVLAALRTPPPPPIMPCVLRPAPSGRPHCCRRRHSCDIPAARGGSPENNSARAAGISIRSSRMRWALMPRRDPHVEHQVVVDRVAQEGQLVRTWIEPARFRRLLVDAIVAFVGVCDVMIRCWPRRPLYASGLISGPGGHDLLLALSTTVRLWPHWPRTTSGVGRDPHLATIGHWPRRPLALPAEICHWPRWQQSANGLAPAAIRLWA